MTLELSPVQARELSHALAVYLEQMEFELARTEQREARTHLRETFDRLEDIKRRLEVLSSSEEAYV
ncbi:MAG: hypothetical protein ACOZIN_05210 [Myxococcota bacterium]